MSQIASSNEDDNNVARMESDIVSLEADMDGLEVEIQRVQSENTSVKKEIERLLQTPDDGRIGTIELHILGTELLALKVYLTNLVREEILLKNQLKDRTDQVLTTAYELHALLKQQLASRRLQLAQAQAKLEQAAIAVQQHQE